MTKSEIINHAAKELLEKVNVDVVEEVFASDYIAHAENKQHKGLDFINRFNKTLHTSIPDIKIVKIEVLTELESMVTWQRTMHGTHKKNMMGIPASNKKIIWNEMVVSRFEGNKIAEEWVVSELMGQLLLKQQKKTV